MDSKSLLSKDTMSLSLRSVWLGDEGMVNAVLVAEGYAQVSTYTPDMKHADEFLELQRVARAEGLGLWGLAPTTATEGDCDPAYPDVCIPSPPDSTAEKSDIVTLRSYRRTARVRR